MTIPIDPTPEVTRLQAAIAATRLFRQRVFGAAAVLDETIGAASLISARCVSIPDEDDVAEAAHQQLVTWCEHALQPGERVALPWQAICDAMRIVINPGLRWQSYRRAWSEVPLEETARHLVETYQSQARTMLATQIHVRLRWQCRLRTIEARRDQLVIPIYAASSESCGKRRIDSRKSEDVHVALKAVASAIAWVDPDAPAPTIPAHLHLREELGDGFAYRRKVPVGLGTLVLFKNRVDLMLTPQASEALALFLSHVEDAETLAA